MTPLTGLTGKPAFTKFISLFYAEGEEIHLKTGHSDFHFGSVTHDGDFVLFHTNGKGTDRRVKGKTSSAFNYLNYTANNFDGGVFFIPGKPSKFPLKDCCIASDILSAELDDGTADEQWERIQEFIDISGLTLTAILTSGGKSYHIHCKLDHPLSIADRTYFMRLIAIALDSDPAVTSPHQPMRIPGFYRKEKGNYQALVHVDDTAIFTPTQWIEGLKKVFAAKELEFPETISDEQWRKYKAFQRDGAFTPERWTNQILHPPAAPIRTRKPTTYEYDGSTIPLEHFLTKDDQQLLANGTGEGNRDNAAIKLAKNLIATETRLPALGIHFSGNAETLFNEFCSRCSPSLPDRDRHRIWRSANHGNPTPTLSDEQLLERAKWYGWEDRKLPWISRERNSATKTRTISKEQWENIKAVYSFREILNQILSKPKECLAITPLRESAKNLGILHYYPGELPDWDEYIAYGCPKIIYKPEHQWEFFAEVFLREYHSTQITTITGGGKSFVAGELFREACGLGLSEEKTFLALLSCLWANESNWVLSKFIWHYILQIELPEDKDGRLLFGCDAPKNVTTPTWEKKQRLVSRTLGEKFDYSKTTPSGRPYIINIKKGEIADIPGNCPFANVFNLVAEELDSFIPGGVDSSVCSRCPHFGKCPFLTERAEQLKSKTDLVFHPSQNGNADVSKDDLILDEIKKIETQKTVTISQRQILENIGQVELSEHPHKNCVKFFLQICARTLYDVYKNGIPQYGLGAEDTFNAILKTMVKQGVELPDFYGLDQDLAIKCWQIYQNHGEYFPHPTTAILEQMINEAIARVLEETSPWSQPTIKDLVKDFNKILANNYDEILAGCQTPEAMENQIQKKGMLNSVKSLMAALYNPHLAVTINETGCFEVVKPNWVIIDNVKAPKCRLLLDATTPPYVTKSKFHLKYLAVAEQEVDQNSCSNLTIRVVHEGGTFARVPQGGTLPETTYQRWMAIGKKLVVDGKKTVLFGYKNHEGLYQELLPFYDGYGSQFSDTTGNNRFQDYDRLVEMSEANENVRQKEAEFQSLFGVFPSGKNRAWFQNWYRQRVLEEKAQMIGRLRPTLTDNPKEVYILAGDNWRNGNDAYLAARFPGCNIVHDNMIDICPEAALKGDRRRRDLLTQAIALAEEGTLKLEELAARLEVTKGWVSRLVKQLDVGGFKQFSKSLLLLLDVLNNKSKLFSELDRPTQLLAKVLEEEGLQGFGQLQAEELAENLNDLTRIVGRTELIDVMRTLPGNVLRDFTGIILSKAAQMMWEATESSPEPELEVEAEPAQETREVQILPIFSPKAKSTKFNNSNECTNGDELKKNNSHWYSSSQPITNGIGTNDQSFVPKAKEEPITPRPIERVVVAPVEEAITKVKAEAKPVESESVTSFGEMVKQTAANINVGSFVRYIHSSALWRVTTKGTTCYFIQKYGEKREKMVEPWEIALA